MGWAGIRLMLHGQRKANGGAMWHGIFNPNARTMHFGNGFAHRQSHADTAPKLVVVAGIGLRVIVMHAFKRLKHFVFLKVGYTASPVNHTGLQFSGVHAYLNVNVS